MSDAYTDESRRERANQRRMANIVRDNDLLMSQVRKAPQRPAKLDREMWMNRWDDWRGYIKTGGGGSWPRDAFESLLDYVDEVEEYIDWLDGKT